MIDRHYPLKFSSDLTAFRFKSIGQNGQIEKFILYQELKKNEYNLAFGDIKDGELRDDAISNNLDAVLVMSTITKSVYLFFEKHPEAILKIEAVDEKRLRFYNTIFRRRYHEILQNFILTGIIESKKEFYQPERFYQKFEIRLKKE